MKTDDRSLHASLKIPTSLYHHPAWVSWKETQGWKAVGALDGQPILCRDLDSLTSMAYIVGNPLSDENDDDYGGRLESLSLRALPFLPSACAFIRWDLMDSPVPDSQDKWMETWLLELRMNASTNRRSFRKAAVESICLDTMVVDLRGGWPIIFSRLAHRVRYSAQLAKRRGTEVAHIGETGLRDFYALYSKTAALHGLRLYPEATYRQLFESAQKKGLTLDLYLAISSDRPVASAIIARTGSEAWYLFAASDPSFRSAAGPTAILFRVLKDCAEAGVGCIDLLGVAPEGIRNHPMSGLSLFKSGFGGMRKSRAGAWDFVLKPDAYDEYAHFEATRVS